MIDEESKEFAAKTLFVMQKMADEASKCGARREVYVEFTDDDFNIRLPDEVSDKDRERIFKRIMMMQKNVQ